MCNCSIRKCKRLYTVVAEKVWVCEAFPNGEGIPDEIAYGDNLHLDPYPGDEGLTYEQENGTPIFFGIESGLGI